MGDLAMLDSTPQKMFETTFNMYRLDSCHYSLNIIVLELCV